MNGMEAQQELQQLDLQTIVKPFARAIDGSNGLITQERLDALSRAYDTRLHSDFQASSYALEDFLVRNSGSLFHLPFRLSLGLHPALGIHPYSGPELNQEATTDTFEAYRNVTILHGYGEWRMEGVQRTKRAASAVFGAIVEAASDRHYYQGELETAMDFVRAENLLDRATSKLLKKTVKIVSSR